MISGLLSKSSDTKHGFLQFSQKMDYGLYLLMELARKDTGSPQISLRSIVQGSGMSFYFMQKVAFDLRKAGLISSGRGKLGGYNLTKPASEITLKVIIEVLEGPITVMHCLIPRASASCERQPKCQIRHGLGTVNQAIIQIFSETTLEHLIHPAWKQSA